MCICQQSSFEHPSAECRALSWLQVCMHDERIYLGIYCTFSLTLLAHRLQVRSLARRIKAQPLERSSFQSQAGFGHCQQLSMLSFATASVSQSQAPSVRLSARLSLRLSIRQAVGKSFNFSFN